ncbi:MAG: HIT family protein [Bacteroidales bacterium]|jgi:histidine triad (HIT) family protein|nr:HIT family protein [Bacteroidales bacterium]
MASIFSKIAAGQIPSYTVAEDERFMAFLDIAPITAGHTLVIPKQEVDYLFDLDEELYMGLQAFARKVAKGLRKAVPCARIAVLVLGMEVPHAHIHLIPINSESDLLHITKKLSLTPAEFNLLRDRIAEAIAG